MTTVGAEPDVRQDLAVVLCTYNGAEHVGEQVASILRQRVLPGELRVYDDGSTDGTLRQVQAAFDARAVRAQAVRLHVAPAGPTSFGAAQNFVRGLLDAPQPLVALSDQDDVWLPDRLAAALLVLDADPAVELVASDALMTDGRGTPVGRTVFEAQHLTRRERSGFDEHEYLPALVRRNLVPGMTFTVRRDLVERLGPVPDGAMHDYWLAVAAATRGTLRILPRQLVRYRIHASNTVGLDTGRRAPLDRVRIKVRSFRAPLTDLPQWLELPERVAEISGSALDVRLDAKRRFEVTRRFPDPSPIARMRTAAALIRGADYQHFDFQGRRAGLRDLIRHRDPYLGRMVQ